MQHDLNTQEKNNSLEVDTELESRAGSLFSGSESNNSEVQDESLFCEKDSSQANQGAKKMRNSTCSHSSIPVDCFALDSQLGEAEKIVTQTNSIEAPTESTSLSLDIGPNLLENQTFNPIGFFDPLQMDLAGLFGSGQPIETVQEIPAGLEEFDASSEIFSWLNFIEDLSTWDGNPETSSIPINYLPPSLITTQGVEHASENQSLTPTALYTSTSDQILITAPHLLTPPSAEPQAGSSGDGGYTGGDDVISSSLPPLALPKKPLKAVKDHKDKSRSTIKDDDDPKKDKKRRDKTGEKAICPVCSKELSARGDVKRHIKSKHPDALKEKSGSTNIDPNLSFTLLLFCCFLILLNLQLITI
ncbi:hypothetical protein BY996DRAFT_326896 [Phakopsora pachyrhizi]|nr:hypothetical protein BY996DRAFT_326896 [Phakopsora pachyrhizi]